MSEARRMTATEREEWRVPGDKCDWVYADRTACLLPVPCHRHGLRPDQPMTLHPLTARLLPYIVPSKIAQADLAIRAQLYPDAITNEGLTESGEAR